MASSSLALRRCTMTKGSLPKARQLQPALLERGIQLDVPGRALIAQATERIAWHKRSAAVLAAELKSMTLPPGPLTDIRDWNQWTRRTDVERKMASHEERARFLAFVARHLVRGRTYRLSLRDLTDFEIKP
jgi:hypothetical protein